MGGRGSRVVGSIQKSLKIWNIKLSHSSSSFPLCRSRGLGGLTCLLVCPFLLCSPLHLPPPSQPSCGSASASVCVLLAFSVAFLWLKCLHFTTAHLQKDTGCVCVCVCIEVCVCGYVLCLCVGISLSLFSSSLSEM